MIAVVKFSANVVYLCYIHRFVCVALSLVPFLTSVVSGSLYYILPRNIVVFCTSVPIQQPVDEPNKQYENSYASMVSRRRYLDKRTTDVYSIMIAIRYPTGLFESNGNLLRAKRKKTAFHETTNKIKLQK